ncbi:unnamed protein product [Aureobasidium mustum]|uniref:Conidiation-specific protein 8 n=1 Tax=Aureobasidium mustum TaxID=2773714 RepID=A0A9N8K4F9_9PEZI|nr:unnamed protein product [Aureobasidium mustum]
MSSPTDTTPASKGSFDGERRRSSGGLFNNILSQKRSPDNAAYSARRASIEEQGPPKGMFGKLWDNAVRGVGPEAQK